MAIDSPPPGWYADITGCHELRYWDGATWTSGVDDDGRLGLVPRKRGITRDESRPLGVPHLDGRAPDSVQRTLGTVADDRELSWGARGCLAAVVLVGGFVLGLVVSVGRTWGVGVTVAVVLGMPIAVAVRVLRYHRGRSPSWWLRLLIPVVLVLCGAFALVDESDKSSGPSLYEPFAETWVAHCGSVLSPREDAHGCADRRENDLESGIGLIVVGVLWATAELIAWNRSSQRARRAVESSVE